MKSKMNIFTKSLIVLTAMAFANSANSEVKLALDSQADLNKSGTFVWASAFKEHLEANGIAVKTFPRGALGGEKERMDQVSQGLLEVSMSAVKSAGASNKLIYGVYLPYLFEGPSHFDAAVKRAGMIKMVNKSLARDGLRLLSFVLVGPSTGIFNTKKPISRVADLADLRMRALDENQIKLFSAWGTTGTIVSWKEVPNALQTGIADGYVNPAFVPLIFGHTDFIKYFTDARVSVSTRIALASEDWYQGLSDKERTVVNDAAAKATAANRAWLKKTEPGMLTALEQAGVAIQQLSPEARAEFVARSKQVYAAGVLTPAQTEIWLKAAEK